MRQVSALVLVLLVSATLASFFFKQPKLERSLKEKLAKNGAKNLPVMVYFEKLNIKRYQVIEDVDERAHFLVNDLRMHSELTQASVVGHLKQKNVESKQLWINNALSIRNCPVEVINWLAVHPLVTKVSLDEEHSNWGIESETTIVPEPAADTHEWNVEYVQATKVWNELKNEGEGVVVGIIDTGAEYKHPAIASQYRGLQQDNTYDHNYNWYQTIGTNSSSPIDDNSHGTHCAGTILGKDVKKGHIYGVAPKAQFISCKCFAGASGTKASVTACLQWMMAPTDLNGQNPDPNKRPHVTSNSWGCNGMCDLEDAIEAVVTAGVMVVAAAGNAGPGCGSVSDPGGLELVLAVGALETKKDNTTAFSSRGPYRHDGSNRIKPDVVAPGRDILSSVLKGLYGKKSGTSMACPHVSGAVALVLSAVPDLKRKPKETQELLQKHARNIFAPANYCNENSKIPNHMYGFGTLQVYDAIKGAKKL